MQKISGNVFVASKRVSFSYFPKIAIDHGDALDTF